MNAASAAPAAASVLPSRSGLSGLTAESVFVGRSMRHSLRDGESLLMAILLPVILMLMFTWVFGGAIDPSGAYVDYVVPGIILLCAGFGSSSTAVYVASDMKAGIIDRFRTMPVRASAVLTGHVIASVLRNLVATSLVVGVALLVGFRPTADVWGWLGAIGMIALWILAITYLFAALGLASGSPEGANAYGFQFHLEADRPMITAFHGDAKDWARDLATSVGDLEKQADREYARWAVIMDRLCVNLATYCFPSVGLVAV